MNSCQYYLYGEQYKLNKDSDDCYRSPYDQHHA